MTPPAPPWTPERLAETKALCEAATPGPWRDDMHGYTWGPNDEMVADECHACEGVRIRGVGGRLPQKDNAAFIAAARTALPDALAEIERLQVEVQDKVEWIDGLMKKAREAEARAWKPIETAPKDGTEVILSGPMSVDFGSWQDEEPEQRESGVIVDPGLPAGWYGYKGMCQWQEQPTLWQPLPPPPARRESEGA